MLSHYPVIKYVYNIKHETPHHVLSQCVSINKHFRKLIIFISSLFNLCEDCDTIRSVMLNQCTCINISIIPIAVFFMALSQYSIRLKSLGHTFEYHLTCKQMYSNSFHKNS